MASTYVNDLRLEEIGTGEASGTWGTKTNNNLELISEAFSYGSEVIADASTHTITLADGTSDQARSFYLKCTGGGQACTVTLAPNTVSKVWMIENATSATLTFSQGTGANVAVATGEVKMIATDGLGSGAVVYDLLTDVNLAGTTAIAALKLGGTAVTSDAGEINLLDGAVAGTIVNDKAVVYSGAGQVNATTLAIAGTDRTGDINLLDGAVAGTIVNSKAVVYSSAGQVNATTLAIAGTPISATVTELNYNDTGASVGTVVASKTVTASANKDVSSLRNLTLTGELDAGTLDISGSGDIDGALDVGGALTNASVAVKVAGLETVYIPANVMYSAVTNGASALTQVELDSTGPNLKCIDFSASATQEVQFSFCFPKSWNEGTVKYQVFWTVNGTNTGEVSWGVRGISFANDATISTAFSGAYSSAADAASGTANDMNVSPLSTALTIVNAAADTQTYFELVRLVGSSDTQTGVARLLGIKLFFTTDAKNDA